MFTFNNFNIINLKSKEAFSKLNYGCFFGPMSREFANGLGVRGSISSRVIPKTQRMVLQHYKVQIKVKVKQSRKVAPFPTPWCSSY